MQVDTGKTAKAKATSGVTKKGTPRVRAPRNCRKCGRPGARADGCGPSHEPLNKSDDDEDEPAPRIATLIARSSIGAGLKNIRENGIDDELADLERKPRRAPPGRISTTDVKPSPPPTSCPHGAGSAASCSQCVLGAARVTRVAIVAGQVVVDGTTLRSTREHTAIAAEAARHKRGRPKKAD